MTKKSVDAIDKQREEGQAAFDDDVMRAVNDRLRQEGVATVWLIKAEIEKATAPLCAAIRRLEEQIADLRNAPPAKPPFRWPLD